MDACRTCLVWISVLGHHIDADLDDIAAVRGTTRDQARRLLLAAYHDHHTEEDSDGVDQTDRRE